MKSKNQVVSLELAKKLKELGVKQESLFVWGEQPNNPKSDWFLICTDNEINEIGYDGYNDYVSAFTVSELGELLHKAHIKDILKAYGFVFNAHDTRFVTILGLTECLVMPDLVAKMLIYLLENNLIQPNER